jgi:uncharacterized membrane protein
MSDPLVSESTFRWILTVLTLAGCTWALYDVVRLVRLPRATRRDRLLDDKRFGYWIGIAVALLGIAGVLRFHGVY